MVSRTPLLQIKLPDLGSIFSSSCWNELIFLPITSLGFFLWTKFLLKGEHLLEILLESILEIFWTREPGFDPELCLPEAPLFHLLFYFPPYCALSVSIVRFFTVVNSPSTIRFVVVWWRACPKGLFGRRRSATTSTRKNLQSFFLGTFYFNNMRSELFAKKILIVFLK